MEFKELIQVRRSVRAYSAPPSREDLEQILKEAQQAPSWKNSQTTRWYVAETPEKREEVRQALHAANQKKAVNAALIVSTYVGTLTTRSATAGVRMISACTMPICCLLQKMPGLTP